MPDVREAERSGPIVCNLVAVLTDSFVAQVDAALTKISQEDACLLRYVRSRHHHMDA